MTVGIGKQSIDFGTIEVWLTDPTLVERRQHEGRVHCSFTMPDPHRPLPPHRRLTLNLSCMASSVTPPSRHPEEWQVKCLKSGEVA
jgi:hypothetical protein